MKTARQLPFSSLLRAAALATCAASSFAGAAPAADAIANTRYTVTIFFPPAPGPDTAAIALNNRTQVVGSRFLPDPRFSATAIWDGKSATDWNTFGNQGSVPNAINDSGKIAGRSLLIPSDRQSQRAVIWCGTTMTYLRTLGGEYGEATAINEAGDVAGYGMTTGGDIHAAKWKGDKIIDLGTLGGAHSQANGINDSGDVVGYSTNGLGGSIATLWTNGKIRNLGTLGGQHSQALDINNKGYIVGWSYVAGSVVPHPALWVNGKIKDLGTLGGDSGYAKSINRAGTIVGYSTTASRDVRGTLWDGSHIVDINTRLDGDTTGITIRNAIAINDNGEILVSGNAPNGSQFMLLTPTKKGK